MQHFTRPATQRDAIVSVRTKQALIRRRVSTVSGTRTFRTAWLQRCSIERKPLSIC